MAENTVNRGRILIVDDEAVVRDSLEQWFLKDGYATRTAKDAEDALRCLQEASFDLALLDIRMPGMDGLELQRRMAEIDSNLLVIMITAYGSVETAVQALKQGAIDYVTKPVDPDELSHMVSRAMRERRMERENLDLRRNIDQLAEQTEIVGDSPPMKKVLELVRAVSQTDATVLIRGESGTGKELIARAVHNQSKRRYFPIIPVNCGALPEALLESELFGHERGSFTGAQYRRKGKLELCDGGTLFLDEIGTISPHMQVDLLRVLETKEFTRVGGSTPIRVDFRTICASNENLEQMVEKGGFREDLYYRINVFTINLPPLRERRADIPLLSRHFLTRFNAQMDKHFTEIGPDAMDLLVRYRWPGNVRELANAIERAIVIGHPPVIRAEDLPFKIEENGRTAPGDSLDDVEKAHVSRILQQTNWNISHAAEILEIDRATLYNKIKKYRLEKNTR